MQAKRQMGKGARATRRVGRDESRPYEADEGLVVRTTLQDESRSFADGAMASPALPRAPLHNVERGCGRRPEARKRRRGLVVGGNSLTVALPSTELRTCSPGERGSGRFGLPRSCWMRTEMSYRFPPGGPQ
jgi:hypothetical protein